MLKQNTSALQESMVTYSEVYKMGVGMLSDFLFSKDFKAVDPSTAFNNLFSNPIFSGFTNTLDRKSTRLNSSHSAKSRMPSSA